MTVRSVERRRPFGVTIIVIVQLANSVVAMLPTGATSDELRNMVGHVGYLQIANPVFGVLGLAVAVGLWLLRRWAWVAIMLWTGLNMAAALHAYWNGHPHFLPMALSVIQVFYLNMREVQVAFLGRSLSTRTPLRG